MKLINLPFSLPGFEVNRVCEDGELLEITAISIQNTAKCPSCQTSSRRVHSYYSRVPADLPISDRRVRLRLRVKRFRCQNVGCTRSTFVENISNLVAKSARRIKRLNTGLEAIAFALGGQAGSRLANKLKLPVSGDTLLRLIRKAPAIEQDKMNQK